MAEKSFLKSLSYAGGSHICDPIMACEKAYRGVSFGVRSFFHRVFDNTPCIP